MKRKPAFTLVELLVVISIIALLLSVLLPALGKARDSAKNIVCRSKIKQLTLGQLLYAQSNKVFAYYNFDSTPPIRAIRSYVGVDSMWNPSAAGQGHPINNGLNVCPSVKLAIKSTPSGQVYNVTDGNPVPYGWNIFLGGYYYQPGATATTPPRYKLRSPGDIKRPSEILGWADSADMVSNGKEYGRGGTYFGPQGYGWSAAIGTGYDKIVLRHGGKIKQVANYWFKNPTKSTSKQLYCTSNAGYVDGHVTSIDKDDITNKDKYFFGNPDDR